VTQRRQSKYIFWGRSRRRGGWSVFDFGSQNGELWCILGAFFAVQLVALHAKSSAYERIEQKAAKQGYCYWKLYIVAFCVELNVTFLNKPNKNEKIQSHYN